MADIELKVALEKVLPFFHINELKKEQMQILEAVLKKKDCIAVLPTGYRKSLPFQIAISVKRFLHRDDADEKIIVCCPLVAWMKDQVTRLNCLPGIKAKFRGDEEEEGFISSGEFDYLFASPESLVGDKFFRTVLQNFEVSNIVIDEFHTISAWGDDDNGKEAFRRWFHHVGELGSLFPCASIVALSATCTKRISKKVMKILNIAEDAVQIFSSPDKQNIKLVVVKIPNTLEIAMSWLIDAVSENKLPRTLLYCNSIKTASSLYSYIITEIQDCKCVEMYHSETPSEKKEIILKAIQNPDSDLRLVIATSSLRMGVDCAKFYNVILYGPPKTFVELIQEIGRVGRDGQTSTALLLYNSFNLCKVESDVKNIIKSDKCRRFALLQPFLNQQELDDLGKNTGSSLCCDICAKVNPDQSSLSNIEKLLTINFNDDENVNLASDSSDDTVSYDYVEDEFFDHFFP